MVFSPYLSQVLSCPIEFVLAWYACTEYVLFRYAYLFSFLVLLLAGKGWEKIEQDDRGLLLGIILVVAALFAVAWGIKPEGSYTYVTMTSFVLTVVFLGIYAFAVGFYQHKNFPSII